MSADDIKLPPLPEPDGYLPRKMANGEIIEIGAITQMSAVEFARAAILADRASRAPSPQGDAERAMCRKHGEALQRVGTALGLPPGTNLHTDCVPAIEALRDDAARYRWLRRPDTGDRGSDLVFRQHGSTLDRSIDAARSTPAKGGEQK